MEDTPEKDKPASPVTSGSESSPAETIQVRTSTPAPTPAPDSPATPEPAAPQAVVSDATPPLAPAPVVSHHGGGKKKRWLKIFIIILLLAAIVAGGYYFYQKDKDNAKAKTTTASKDVPLIKMGVITPDYGDLYPAMPPSEYSTLVNNQMFEGLVRYENKDKIVPNLATTWTNPDDKTWLFTIAPNIKFHDGHTLKPQDVKYSFDTVMATNPDLADLFASTIASVDVVGNNQVKITTKEADPILLNRLAFLFVIDANPPKGSEPSQAGTGAYYIKPGTKPSGKSMQMVAFDGYHDGRPTTRALSFGGNDDTDTVVKDFQNGKYNIAGAIPVTDAAKEKAKGVSSFSSTSPNIDYISFNTVKAGPLQNKLVREAIRYAVNASEIGKGNGNETVNISQMIPPSIPGYNPAITPYKQDIAKAKQLLVQAGYPNGLTLTLDTADPSEATTALVANLKAAGITVNVKQHNDFDEFIDYFGSGKAEMFTVNYSSDTLDGLDILDTAFPSTLYSNPKFTALTTQISTTTDPAKRLKLLQQAEQMIDDDVAAVPLYSEDAIWLVDNDYTLQQDMPSSLISVYFYKVQYK